MRRLGVLAKRTAEGQVKTRLSPALPAALAARLHAAMLEDTLAAANAARVDARELFLAGPGEPPPADEGWTLREQADGDLGVRLAAAFDVMLGAPGSQAVAIGADSPDLDAAALERAFAALDTHDVVLGPAADGGYWLIGLTRPAPELFRDIPWSTESVYEETRVRAAALGLRVATLETLADIDTPADLAAWIGAATCDASPRAPATRRALAAMGLLPSG